MRLFSEHRLLHYNVRDFGQTAKTPKPMVMNQSLSANGKGIVQGPITTTNVKNGHLVGGAALPKAPTPSLPVGTGVAALDWAGRSQSHPQYGIPPSNPTEQQLNERYGVTPGWGVPNQGPNGSIDPRTGLQYSNSNNPGFGGGLQTTYNAIDAKYRAASDAGQSVDPTAVAAEKQAAAAQFQAEESARQGQMQAARDKEAKSVAMSQNALTAKTPQGQKIQQITAIRQNVRLGKITQEQANAQIQQIQSQSAASPQAPVAAPTSPTAPTPANPNASTATTPAVPGAAAVGTQEAAATGTEPAVDENGNPIAKPPATPEEAGMDAAMLNLPPEAAFLAPFLQSLKTQTDKSIEENAQMALGQLATVEKTFGGIQDKLDGMEAGYKSTTEAMQSLLREAKESQEKQIAEAEKDQMNRVQWQQDTQERVIMKNKRQAHEAMVAQLALNGGFGQDASLRAVAESDDHFETQLADLRTEMGYARTDLSVKFSGLKNEATQNYVNSTITNMKELQANLEKISFQGMSNKVSKMQAEQAIVKDAWEKQNTLRKDLADKQYNITSTMAKMAQDERESKVKNKNDLWDRWFRQRAQDGNSNVGLSKQILNEMKASGIDVSGIDPTSMTLDQSNEIFRRYAESEKNSGKTPLSTQVKLLTDADNSFALLDRAERAISEYANVGGPIAGMTGIGDIEKDTGFIGDVVGLFRDPAVAIATSVPLAGNALERQREAVATFNLVKQVIGKAMEGGVLRKEDEAKYERLLPTLRDTDRLRTYKLTQLREAMKEGKKALLNNMQMGGYNTSGYNMDPSGKPYDPISGSNDEPLTNEDADEILQSAETGEPLSMGTPTGLLNALANAHMRHEGYGSAGAPTITAGNNPGALRWNPAQAAFGGKPGPKNFTVFPDFNSGYKALVADLRAKLTGKSAHIDYSANPTLLSYVKVYAPTADGNDPKGYAAALVKELRGRGYDINLNTPLSELSHLIS